MSGVENIYAQALYRLAQEDGVEDTVQKQLQFLCQCFAREPVYLQLLNTRHISKTERCNLLDTGFRGKVHPYVLNFLKLLTEKGSVRYFPQCCWAYEKIYDEQKGILPVCAVSAVPLSKKQREQLTRKLSAITGKTVQLTNRTDPACLGGVRLDYRGTRIDGTLKNRAETIRTLLKDTVL